LIIKEKAVTGKETQKNNDEEQAAVLCEVCGSAKVEEDGKLICPRCDAEIDYFGDEDDIDIK